ncbi:type II secretion system protein [Pelagicoccus sp. SDUM812005]|uniref:type II secretion system protein n=1 Tax=Pelagicoccus sp. SDUM812005 TaxID=3041257 RepID=UPI00280D95B7|nr:type II secretion system protein [Pelagicoccus sp. SDUM812005]MDQ8179819.1 type II secretion system protein [Pelagicoccus sp. SDUM812005]
MRSSARNFKKRAFTLTEVMVTTVVAGLILGTVMSFLVSTANFAAYNEGKLLVNHDIRKFTSELSDNATYSNFFVIYESFTNRTVVDDGGSGDFLVLAFVDDDNPSLYTAVIGFYRAATADSEGPVMRFSTLFDSPQADSLENLLPAPSTLGTHNEIIELSKGLSDGQLFYNFFNRSITVQGEILHQGSNLKRATNTYNFTVSPRG